MPAGLMMRGLLYKGSVTFSIAQQARTFSDRVFPIINPTTKKKTTPITQVTQADVNALSAATNLAFENELKGHTHEFTK
ncbi:hypothetical protein HW132_26935 [Brasilonema sp. CT11]|nr:hypothetical protein [Brasilonema sp. CT11]